MIHVYHNIYKRQYMLLEKCEILDVLCMFKHNNVSPLNA